jgi:hypothetical protein
MIIMNFYTCKYNMLISLLQSDEGFIIIVYL